MRHGWAYIYGYPPASLRFQELTEVLPHYGITLENPKNHDITRLSGDGKRIVCTRQDLMREFERSTEVPFQLWLDSNTGVFCSIDKVRSERVRESYGLAGKTRTESLNVVAALTQLFIRRTVKSVSFAFVVDEHAELYRDFHWDDFILGTALTPPEWPLLLAFSKDSQRLDSVPRDRYAVEESDTYILLRKLPTSTL